MTTAIQRLADLIERQEARWSWESLDFTVKTVFIARLADRLPRFDPQVEWEAMPVRYRRELAWHLSRTPQQLHCAWEEDCHRLSVEADEATAEAFRELTTIEGGS